MFLPIFCWPLPSRLTLCGGSADPVFNVFYIKDTCDMQDPEECGVFKRPKEKRNSLGSCSVDLNSS